LSSSSFKRLEEELAVLKRVADALGGGSAEHAVVSRAAIALVFSATKHENEFERFSTTLNDPLADDQKQKLRELRLKADD
jgi:hypothetical protein